MPDNMYDKTNESNDPPIYIHYWDREILSIFGYYSRLSSAYIEYNMKLSLLSTNNWMYIAASALFESKYVIDFFKKYNQLFNISEQLIKTIITFDNLKFYIKFKQDQYRDQRNSNVNYFSDFWLKLLESDITTQTCIGNTTNRIESYLLSLNSKDVKNIADITRLKYPYEDIELILPYFKENIYRRDGRAITHKLIESGMNEKEIHNVVKKSFDYLNVESFIQQYINYFKGTIVTGLQGITNFYAYLSPTYPLNDLSIWKIIYRNLGCDKFLLGLSAAQICDIRRDSNYIKFIQNMRRYLSINWNNVKSVENLQIKLDYLIKFYCSDVIDLYRFITCLKILNDVMDSLDENEIIIIDTITTKKIMFEKKDAVIKKGDSGMMDMYDVQIGIITALPEELVMMKSMLMNVDEHIFEGEGAGHRYYVGEIKSVNDDFHKVAVGFCGMGNNSAAIRVTNMSNHFKKLKSIIMCGIACGIPSPDNIEDHIRLGDVVVSTGISQFDFVKNRNGKIECRSEPPKPEARLLEAVGIMQALERENRTVWRDYVCQMVEENKSLKPKISTDKVYDSNGTIIKHPKDTTRKGNPKVFYKKIASSNTLLKNSKKREELKKKFNVGAVEMEGSGVADASWSNDVGYIVIRGICDYGDIHKNDIWHDYAALVAAAYTRNLIELLPKF